MSGKGALNIEVENFGPIVEARLDLRPLTILVGSGNAGKSYLATLVYALHRFFDAGNSHLFGPSLPWEPDEQPDSGLRSGIGLAASSLDRILRQLFGQLYGDTSELQVTVPAGITRTLGERLEARGDAFRQLLRHCYGSDLGDNSLVRRGSRAARVSFEHRLDGTKAVFGHEVRFTPSDATVRVSMPGKVPLPLGKDDAQRLLDYDLGRNCENLGVNVRHCLDMLHRLMLRRLAGPLDSSSYYLPPDRTGLMRTHKLVLSSLLASAPMGRLSATSGSSYLTGVVSGFIDRIISMQDNRPGKSLPGGGCESHAKAIEDRILNGDIEVELSPVGFPEFFFRPSKWNGRKAALPLIQASAAVAELAPLVLFLRNKVMPGDILILEEPESHLHPEQQVELIEQLAAIVNSGIRIVLTTHSEFLLEALANIVRRSLITTVKKTRYVDAVGVSLRHDQVGAWMFEHRKKPLGSVVKEITMDDSGMYQTGFDDVANAIHNEGSLISWEIEAMESLADQGTPSNN